MRALGNSDMISVFRRGALFARGTCGRRIAPKHAGIAQLVEQRIRNAKVVGSTPIAGTKNIKHLGQPLGVGLLLFRCLVTSS